MDIEAAPRAEMEQPKPNLQDALRTRLLFGGNAINPDFELSKDITPEDLVLDDVMKHESVNRMISNASIYERSSVTDTVDEWKSKMVSYVTQFAPTNEQDPEQMQKAQFLADLGYDPRAFDASAADALYREYFSTDVRDKSANIFINKVLGMYNNADGSVNLQKLKGDERMIKSLAGIFGTTCSDLISEKIQAMAEAQTNMNGFLAKANSPVDSSRVVDLISREKDLPDDQKSREYKNLKFLWDHGNPVVVTTTPPVILESPPAPPLPVPIAEAPPQVQPIAAVESAQPVEATPSIPVVTEIPQPPPPPIVEGEPPQVSPTTQEVTGQPQQEEKKGFFQKVREAFKPQTYPSDAERKRQEAQRQQAQAVTPPQQETQVSTETPGTGGETGLIQGEDDTNPIAPHRAANADTDDVNVETQADTGGTLADRAGDPDPSY